VSSSPASCDDIHIGIGLWSMRSTAYSPSPFTQLYADLIQDARLAEELGFDSLWLAEHHNWYDGWCPQPLVAASVVLAATKSLHVGTGMYLLPQHDIDVTSRDVETLLTLYGPRLELGIALGYRPEEYRAVGIPFSRRGALMESHIRALRERSAAWPGEVPLWVGGLAEPAIRRAGRHGLSLLLPNSLRPSELKSRIEIWRDEANAHGREVDRLGMLVDTWIVPDGSPPVVQAVRDRLAVHYREYSGAFFELQGAPGFTRPDLLDVQSARTRAAAVVGDATAVVAGLRALKDDGVNAFVLQIRSDALPSAYRKIMRQLAQDVLPKVR
jgi:alkanesulfonate monooxygenase SsuD/methylene tetrahydromethanopterin reductase-like flavin-dependent oxidoreductase (luciferase family)